MGPKWPICPEQNFFGTNHYYYFHLPIGPFHCAKFKKILTADPELWGCAIFGPKMVHLPQTNFFWKIINIILIYLLAPFIVQNFKKILPVDPELWGCTIFGPKMAHIWSSEDFFRKPVNEPCFFHSCLSAPLPPPHFWSFLSDGDFFPKNWLCHTHNYVWASNTIISFRKNQWANSEKTYGQMEGQAEGRTDPIL